MMLLEEKINIAIENLAIRAIRKNKYSLQTIADICELPLKRVKYLKRFSEHVTLKKIMNCSPEEAYVWKIIKTSAGMLEFEKLFKEQPPLTQKYAALLIEYQVEKRKWLGLLTTESEFFWILGFVNASLETVNLEPFTEKTGNAENAEKAEHEVNTENTDEILDILIKRYEKIRFGNHEYHKSNI